MLYGESLVHRSLTTRQAVLNSLSHGTLEPRRASTRRAGTDSVR